MIFLNKISVCKKDSKINEVNPNLQKLHKMAQSWPLCPKVDLADDVTIVKTKVKERLDESTIIDVEQDIFNRLEKNSICNPHPGQEIKISHLGEDTQAELKKIFTKYEGAFATTPYDCGEYHGLVVSLDVVEGKTAYQKERVMRDKDKIMVQQIIDNSVQAEIF